MRCPNVAPDLDPLTLNDFARTMGAAPLFESARSGMQNARGLTSASQCLIGCFVVSRLLSISATCSFSSGMAMFISGMDLLILGLYLFVCFFRDGSF